ncbi:MbcA/ParS/Xre antitoxin family protein [Bordetella genomosp. 13]|uniref:MbcA/ParS/Xre antitoxin family protein n=1 Tax=Bordetella genomosp. 13 TaxID=463040 RepID=UPI0021B56389|nr:MbcA/ParS/Xre antitoxin family protein [Bordetella genomosp. 13]
MRDVLNARLRKLVGHSRATRSATLGVKLFPVLREAIPQQREWRALVPSIGVLDEARDAQALRPNEAIALYRLLRLVWLAELVFGDQALAHDWLSSPKAQLYGAVPVGLVGSARHAGHIERWLLNIEEGNGP